MKTLGNFLWFVFCGGLLMGLSWWILGVVMYVIIIGIPWGKACFVIGKFSFLPFGKEAVKRKDLHQEDDVGTGALGLIGNVIWFFLAGFWLALGHITFALTNFVTIIGIPFGIQHLKLAQIALAPVGKTIIPKEIAVEIRKELAEKQIKQFRKKRQV